jgi:hypothetical protein
VEAETGLVEDGICEGQWLETEENLMRSNQHVVIRKSGRLDGVKRLRELQHCSRSAL